MIPLVILISLLLAFAIMIALYIESHSPKQVGKLTDDPKILFEEKNNTDIEVL